MSSKIRHDGVVERIGDGIVTVRILQTSACAGCKIASHCHSALSPADKGSSEAKERLVDVKCATGASSLTIGQPVVVTASAEVAGLALFYGFGLPFLLLLAVLLGVYLATGSELQAGLWSLLSLLPYYLVLWLLRSAMARRLSFELEE